MPAGNDISIKLERARRELLDLGKRNRLINTPRHRIRLRTIEVIDEVSQEVYRILVDEQKNMSFVPVPDSEAGEEGVDEEDLFAGFIQPEDDEVDERGIAKRHTDTRLQTALTSERLQKKLLGLYYTARTSQEEQGVNILYLALGFLKWYESESSDQEYYAPLILVPVSLDRQSARERFKLRYLEEDISTNLSLQELLKADHGVDLPDVPDDDDLSPNTYYDDVVRAVSGQPRWEVLPNDMILSLFSFSKFLMFRDLNPENWPENQQITEHPLISGLLAEGFRADPPLCGDDDKIDQFIDPSAMVHVLDADSSQMVTIEEVKRGRNLVIQGPPGTGKSQTIANLMAAGVKEGKKVLFVSEKMAALDVVKRRMDAIGLGEICFELHSHKANKRHVLEDLKRTLDLTSPIVVNVERVANDLKRRRDTLNLHCQLLHERAQPSGLTPYRVIGELVALRARGVPPADFALNGADQWTDEEVREKQNLLEDVVGRIEEIGTPNKHPWRGVGLEVALPNDIDRLAAHVGEILPQLERFVEVTTGLAEFCKTDLAVTAEDAFQLARFGKRIAALPTMDRRNFPDPVWGEWREEISRLVEVGQIFAANRKQLESIVTETGWASDVTTARRDLAGYGNSLFRLLNANYRRAQATLRGILVGPPPKALRDRLFILDTLITGQVARDHIEKNNDVGKHAFGFRWQGENSDWEALAAIDKWDKEASKSDDAPENFREIVAQLDEVETAGKLVKEVNEEGTTVQGSLRHVFDLVQLDLKAAFDVDREVNEDDEDADEIADEIAVIPLDAVHDRLQAWRSNMEEITKWIALRLRWERLFEEGLGELAERLYDGRLLPESAVDPFRIGYLEVVMKEIAKEHPDIPAFDGKSHGGVVELFKSLDIERIKIARDEVAQAHYAGMPKGIGSVGEIGILHREFAKKRRHLPLRKLMKQAGVAIQAIKPVFMMSPMSIAQFLEPGLIQFDLLLIDEASQVRPVDALGAVARSNQIAVVGDDKQLPPSRFFSKLVDDSPFDEDDPETFAAGDLESILGLATAQGVPQRMLRWHYRSRHHSLVAVSNQEFYDDKLYVIPSPFTSADGLGVCFHFVSNGVFDRGGSATNRVEAEVVALAVIEHARTHPKLTLGVGAFSIKQKQAILDALELLWRTEDYAHDFFVPGGPEPFFVKNLENIQGDERDVIFISVGYGHDESGFFSMTFGPLSADGGERRLNVLITRARQRCEIFSSIKADDIDLARAKGRGPAALKTYLHYAETGILGIGQPTGREHDSPFEEEVARALHANGYKVDAQVGSAGFFIDLAVIDPDRPGRYILGIECDGAAYHSSRSARDRDRLRQQVLEDHGWIIHRIWSTDWFYRPEEQLRKTLLAIENAKIEFDKRSRNPGNVIPKRPANSVVKNIKRKDEKDEEEAQGLKGQIISYREASFPVPKNTEPHKIWDSQMAYIVTKIVEVEGPIHEEEVARRVAALWGRKRTGSRIMAKAKRGLKGAAKGKRIEQTGSFYTLQNSTDVRVRNRENVTSPNLRKTEFLPPMEIREAVLLIVRTHMGATKEDAAIEGSRLFGFKATSAELRKKFDREIRKLLNDGSLIDRNHTLYCQ